MIQEIPTIVKELSRILYYKVSVKDKNLVLVYLLNTLNNWLPVALLFCREFS